MINKHLIYDKSATLPNVGYSRVGYTFVGWTLSPEGTGTLYKNKQSVKNITTDSPRTLYAKWNVITYDIRYDGNGADNSDTVTYQQLITIHFRY